MDLMLKNLEIEEHNIITEDGTFKVAGNIPIPLYQKIMKLSEMGDGFTAENIGMSLEIIKECLYIKNDKKIIDAYIEKLDIQGMNDIFVFLMDIIGKHFKKKIDTKS